MKGALTLTTEVANKSILDCLLNTRSPFVFVNGSSTSTVYSGNGTDKELKSLSKNDVNFMYYNNVFTLSDLHVVKYVAENIFCTVPMLKRSIKHYHETTEDSQKVILSVNTEHLKERLDTGLCRAQILVKTLFASHRKASAGDNNRKEYMSYYTCTPHGYNFIKRLIGYDRPYDEYSSILALDQVFKYLSVITVCQTFYDIPGFKNYKINNQEYTVNIKTGRKYYSPYGVVNLEAENNRTKVIIEPFFRSYNKSRISGNAYIAEVKERFANIGDYLQKNFDMTHLIFSCEDISAIKAAVDLTKEYLPGCTNKVYFTIDKEANKNGIENACLYWNGKKTVPIELHF